MDLAGKGSAPIAVPPQTMSMSAVITKSVRCMSFSREAWRMPQNFQHRSPRL
jgi:hypothetical protein